MTLEERVAALEERQRNCATSDSVQAGFVSTQQSINALADNIRSLRDNLDAPALRAADETHQKRSRAKEDLCHAVREEAATVLGRFSDAIAKLRTFQ